MAAVTLMLKPNAKIYQMPLRIPVALARDLDRIATTHKSTRSDIVRMALQQYVDGWKHDVDVTVANYENTRTRLLSEAAGTV